MIPRRQRSAPGHGAQQDPPPGKRAGSGEGTPTALLHPRGGAPSCPDPLPLRGSLWAFASPGQLWRDVQGSGLTEGERCALAEVAPADEDVTFNSGR